MGTLNTSLNLLLNIKGQVQIVHFDASCLANGDVGHSTSQLNTNRKQIWRLKSTYIETWP